MGKGFLDIKIGDKVTVIDEYSREYIVHTLKVTSIEEDSEYVTRSNPKGIHCYGDDMDYFNESDEDGFNYLTHIHEGNFIEIISSAGHDAAA